MNYTNHLDRLPVELHMYINDILESDREYHKQRQRARDYLKMNFIRYKESKPIFYKPQ